MTPAHAQQALQHALTHHRAGRLAEAAVGYQRVRSALPRNFDALHLGGLVALQRSRWDEAVELLNKAVAVDLKSASCRMRLGQALMGAGRAADAVDHLRHALALDPRVSEAWEALARALKLLDRLEEAVGCHEKALALKPDSGLGWYNFGLTLTTLGRTDEALVAHERALRTNPPCAKAHFGRAQALLRGDRLREAIAAVDEHLKLEPGDTEAQSTRLFALNYLPELPRERLFAEHVAYGRGLPAASSRGFRVSLDPARRLRLGVLSPDLRSHSCAYFIEPLLRHLDRRDWDVYLYHDHFRTDAVSERLQALASSWKQVVGISNDRLEAVIRSDAPDILLDLAGHTGLSNRLPLFARRVAPVQVSYLGYPNTTGVPAMDYRLTDGVADPVGEADDFATEQLVRFAPTAWAYQAPEGCPPVSPPPVLNPGSPVTFGCFNHPGKIMPEMLSAWSRILAQVAGSRLLLKGHGLASPQAQERLLRPFIDAGIEPRRILFSGRTAGTAEHLAMYGKVDVALDTFPYNGTTTTCEALWMGVPVVSLRGDRHLSRVGASLLSAVGLPEWIAATQDDYVRIAVELAADAQSLAAHRVGLRAQIQSSPLGDHAGQALRFATALRGCWCRWVQRAQVEAGRAKEPAGLAAA